MRENEFDEPSLVGKVNPAERTDATAGESALADLPVQMGNREFTRQVVGPVQRSGRSQGAGPLDPEIETDIRSAQGGGRPLDDHVRADMESNLGADLSRVRVHDDSRGDMLSRSVQADAFTTGSDVFFRSGKYSPGSGDGRKLLAHELTHVVQQSSGQVPDESRVSHPDDSHEVEARSVADSLASPPAAGLSPELEDDVDDGGEGGGALSRQEAPEEEELEDDMPLSRMEAAEDELLEEELS